MVLLLLTFATAYLGQWAGRESGNMRVWLGVGCALSAGGAAWVKVAQTRRERTVEAARAEAEEAKSKSVLALSARDVTAFGSALKPGIEELAKLASAEKGSPESAEVYAAIRNKMVDAASTLTGGDGVRAMFFRRADVAGVPTLVRSEYSGAMELSGRVFRDHSDDPAGKAVWAALGVGKVVRWPDVSEKAPPGWDVTTQSRPYRTLMMAPVLGPDQQIHGMLSVDALEPNTFTLLDEKRIAAFAALLGAAAHVRAGK